MQLLFIGSHHAYLASFSLVKCMHISLILFNFFFTMFYFVVLFINVQHRRSRIARFSLSINNLQPLNQFDNYCSTFDLIIISSIFLICPRDVGQWGDLPAVINPTSRGASGRPRKMPRYLLMFPAMALVTGLWFPRKLVYMHKPCSYLSLIFRMTCMFLSSCFEIIQMCFFMSLLYVQD